MSLRDIERDGGLRGDGAGGVPDIPVLRLSERRAPSIQRVILPERGSEPADIKTLYKKDGRWREVGVAAVGVAKDPLAASIISALTTKFAEQGHTVFPQSSDGRVIHSGEDVDILMVPFEVPSGSAKLKDRIPDSANPFEYIALKMRKKFGIRKNPGHLIGVTVVDESLSELSHNEVVEAGRNAMARLGVPTVCFITRAEGNKPKELMLVTPEGGSNPIPANNLQSALAELRDSILTISLTSELKPEVDNKLLLPKDEYERGIILEMIEHGKRMDGLGYLPKKVEAKNMTRQAFKLKAIQKFMETQSWAEGAWMKVFPQGFAVPGIGTMYITATGSAGADKQHMTERDVVPTSGVLADGKLHVHPPHGVDTRKISVEGKEFARLIAAAPKIRLRKVGKFYIPDDNGPIVTSKIAAIGHAHISYTSVDSNLVEHISPNYKKYKYRVGCGTDQMEAMSLDYVGSSQVINDPDDERFMGISLVNSHGVVFYVTWGMPIEGKDGEFHQGMEAALELLDRESWGAVTTDTNNIPQYPIGLWKN